MSTCNLTSFSVSLVYLQKLNSLDVVERRRSYSYWGFAARCMLMGCAFADYKNHNTKRRCDWRSCKKNVKSVLLHLRKNRHWLNIRAAPLIWLREENFLQILYLFFGFWGQFLEQSHFFSSRRNSCIQNFPIYLTREEGCVRAELHLWTGAASKHLSQILAICFFSWQV